MIVAGLALSGCVATTQPPVDQTPSQPSKPAAAPAKSDLRQFAQVVRTVEPVAERECRERTSGLNCDFKIVVDDAPSKSPNAFQTLDKQGPADPGLQSGADRLGAQRR